MLAFFGKWMGDKLVLIGGAALLALTVMFSVRQAGKQAERLKSMRATLRAVGVRNEVEINVGGADPDVVRERLRDKWARD